MTTTFDARLAAKHRDLEIIFYRLYGNRPNAARDFENLLSRMKQLFEARRPTLVAQDNQRDKQQHWTLSNEHVGMALYVDRFCGSLKNLNEQLDYLQDLGVNLLHLMPIMERPPKNNDGGYAVSNFLKVDKQFGTNEDLKSLVSNLKARGMNLMLDFVMNHTADSHEWAKEARKGSLKYQEYYHTYPSQTIPDAFEENLAQVFPETSPNNFVFDPEMKRWVHSTFYWYQWDLNYKNSEVFVEMVCNLLGLLNLGVDIVRMDAPAFIWKELGGTSQNLEEVHLILTMMKICCDIVAPGTALLSEAIVAPYEIMKYFGTGANAGKECELCYNALTMALLWDTVATENAQLLNVSLRTIPHKPYGATWLNYVRCHDDIGLGYDDSHIKMAGFDPFEHRRFLIRYFTEGVSNAKGEKYMFNPETGDARISGTCAALVGLEKAVESGNEFEIELRIQQYLMLHSIILSLGGIPMLYYGDEFAAFNDHSYIQVPEQAPDNRWMHRPLYDWNHLKDIEDSRHYRHKIFYGLKNLISLRKMIPEFADHNNVEYWDFKNKHIFAYRRSFFEAETLIIVNVSKYAHPIRVEQIGQFNLAVDKITNERPFEYAEVHLLKPYTFLWLKR